MKFKKIVLTTMCSVAFLSFSACSNSDTPEEIVLTKIKNYNKQEILKLMKSFYKETKIEIENESKCKSMNIQENNQTIKKATLELIKKDCGKPQQLREDIKQIIKKINEKKHLDIKLKEIDETNKLYKLGFKNPQTILNSEADIDIIQQVIKMNYLNTNQIEEYIKLGITSVGTMEKLEKRRKKYYLTIQEMIEYLKNLPKPTVEEFDKYKKFQFTVKNVKDWRKVVKDYNKIKQWLKAKLYKNNPEDIIKLKKMGITTPEEYKNFTDNHLYEPYLIKYIKAHNITPEEYNKYNLYKISPRELEKYIKIKIPIEHIYKLSKIFSSASKLKIFIKQHKEINNKHITEYLKSIGINNKKELKLYINTK